jgi:hypothetical protein
MYLHITGNRDELDTFLADFRAAFSGRYVIGHYTRGSCDRHVHVGFLLAGPRPPEQDPRERVDDATAERLAEAGMDSVEEIARRLVESGAVVAVMAPGGRVYTPAEVTLVGPADGPQEPSSVTYVDEDGVEHDITDITYDTRP